MKGVTIKDSRIIDSQGFVLDFDLIDILEVIKTDIISSNWLVSPHIECSGEGSEELYRIAEGGTLIDGFQLVKIASKLVQVIDGEFKGYLHDNQHHWILIRAIDSSFFDVLSTDDKVLEKLTQHFRDIEPYIEV